MSTPPPISPQAPQDLSPTDPESGGLEPVTPEPPTVPSGRAQPLVSARNSENAISARSTIALIVSGLLVALLCIGGAAIGGFFSDASQSKREPAGPDGNPSSPGADRADNGSTTFGDGAWLVGTDIRSGTYETTVPTKSANCAWERASSTDGSEASILDSGVVATGTETVVTIRPTDVVFRSEGCGSWRPVKS